MRRDGTAGYSARRLLDYGMAGSFALRTAKRISKAGKSWSKKVRRLASSPSSTPARGLRMLMGGRSRRSRAGGGRRGIEARPQWSRRNRPAIRQSAPTGPASALFQCNRGLKSGTGYQIQNYLVLMAGNEAGSADLPPPGGLPAMRDYRRQPLQMNIANKASGSRSSDRSWLG